MSKVVKSKVRNLLAASEEYRNSDKKLLLAYWEGEGLILDAEQQRAFLLCTPAETITRRRREMRGEYPGNKDVEDRRYELYKEETLNHSNRRSVV